MVVNVMGGPYVHRRCAGSLPSQGVQAEASGSRWPVTCWPALLHDLDGVPGRTASGPASFVFLETQIF